MKKVLVAVAVVGLMVSPAVADSVHIGNTTNNTTNNQGGQGGAGGIGVGGNASATGGTHVQTNTQVNSQTSVNTNVNTLGQGQRQSANNEGNSQKTNIKVESQMIPGVAVAPGLTSGGSQVCLGSFSVGLSGPMAGVAFGKTTIDKGCEDRQHAILLFNMGYAKEALELLKAGNDRVRVLFAGNAEVGNTKLSLNTPLGAERVAEPTIAQAMEQTQLGRVESVQGN